MGFFEEEGPIRKRLREKGFLKRGLLSSPQEIPYEKLIKDVMSSTGLSEGDAMRFIRDIGTHPYLYIFYDPYGKVVDWDSRRTEEEVRYYVKSRFPQRPELFKGYKIFKVSVSLEEIERLGIP